MTITNIIVIGAFIAAGACAIRLRRKARLARVLRADRPLRWRGPLERHEAVQRPQEGRN